jgi:hypothetical protein
MTTSEQTQPRKSYTTVDVVHRFAAQGVAIDTISRALVAPAEHVRAICQRAKENGFLAGIPPETNETAADRKLALRMEVVNLRERLADSEALVKELRTPIGDAGNLFAYDSLVHLTACEMKMLNALVTHGRLSKDRLYHELYGQRVNDDTPEPKIIDVFICKLRAKLRGLGVEIETRWGHGYEMLPAMVTRLNELAGVTVPRVDAPSLVPEQAAA